MSSDPLQAVIDYIERSNLHNKENLINAIEEKWDEEFEANYGKYRWYGQTLRDIVLSYRLDEYKREVTKEQMSQTAVEERSWDYQRNKIISIGMENIKDKEFITEKRLQAKNTLEVLALEQKKIRSPVLRMKLAERDELIEFWDSNKKKQFIENLVKESSK